MTNENASEQNITKDTQSEVKKTSLERHIERALKAVQLLPISDDLQGAKKTRFARLNQRLLDAAKKRAVAEFKEMELRRKAETAKARAAAQNESTAKRRRREHLCYTLGAYDLSNGLANKSVNINYVMSMLLTMENVQKYNKLKSELVEFLPFLAQNEQFMAAKFEKKGAKE